MEEKTGTSDDKLTVSQQLAAEQVDIVFNDDALEMAKKLNAELHEVFSNEDRWRIIVHYLKEAWKKGYDSAL